MRLIPVLDLIAGRVVRAVRGQRALYRPIRSSLCRGSEPLDVAAAMLRYCASDLLYLADLDALAGRPAQCAAIADLLCGSPDLTIWLDAGFRRLSDWHAIRDRLGAASRRVTPVFASESLASPGAAWQALAPEHGAILSLDRRRDPLPDLGRCWLTPGLWPSRVIVMTLDRVGSDQGPDLATLAELQRQRPELHFVGAGGIRSDADLAAAREGPAEAWLVASAIHDRNISPTSAA